MIVAVTHNMPQAFWMKDLVHLKILLVFWTKNWGSEKQVLWVVPGTGYCGDWNTPVLLSITYISSELCTLSIYTQDVLKVALARFRLIFQWKT